MQHLVRREGEAKLRTGTQYPCRAALKERAETLLCIHCPRTVAQRCILGLALSSLNLETGLDNVAGRGEIGGRHAGDGASSQELDDAKFLVRPFAKEVTL